MQVNMMHMQHIVKLKRCSAADDFVLHCIQTLGWLGSDTFATGSRNVRDTERSAFCLQAWGIGCAC